MSSAIVFEDIQVGRWVKLLFWRVPEDGMKINQTLLRGVASSMELQRATHSLIAFAKSYGIDLTKANRELFGLLDRAGAKNEPR